MGNVAAHTPKADGDSAGIGICLHQRAGRAAADIHIHAAYHHRIGAVAQYIAFSGNIALFQEIGNMHRHGRAGDLQSIRDTLLGDHGIRFDEAENLPFSLRHAVSSINLCLFLNLCLV